MDGKKKMKISIATISFNQASFLDACIDSVANQEGPWEHIIVDPGSTDGSLDIIEANRAHFSHIVLEKDEGPADGLNKGFARATGEIFYYLNSDDIVLPGAFKEARKFLEHHPEVDVVSGGGYIIDENGNKKRKLWSDPVSRFGLAHGGSILIQPSTFIRHKAFQMTTGFNVHNSSNWDSELIVDLFEKEANFKQLKRFWSGYRIHQGSITGTAQLDEKINAWGRRRYEKLVGKKPNDFYFKTIGQYFRAMRIFRNPSIVLDRIRSGKVYGGMNEK